MAKIKKKKSSDMNEALSEFETKSDHVIKKLSSCVKEYKLPSILTPICVLFEVICEVLIPLVMAQIIDAGSAAQNGATVFDFNLQFGRWAVKLFSFDNITDMTLVAGAFMVLLALVSLTAGTLGGRFAAVASTGFAKNVRQKEYYKIQQFSFLNIDHFSTSGLVTRLTTDVTNVQMAYMVLIRMFTRAPIMLVLALVMAISISPDLSLVFAVAIPIIVIGLVIGVVAVFPRFSKMLKKYDKMNESTEENVTGIRTIKAFAREDYETERFKKVSEEVQKLQFNAEKIIVIGMPLLMFVIFGCIVAIVWFGGNNIMVGSMTLGDFSAFLNYVMQIMMSVTMVGIAFFMVVLARASAGRICEVFDEKIDITDSPSAVEDAVKDGSVDFDNVDFSYSKNPEKLNLENIDLHIKSGETVGIIGGTGSAKTTLVQLVPRLYDVLDGSVKIGGRDVREYKLESVRSAVAMVLQNNTLFSGTIKENLKWGNPDATDEEIERAAKAAQAHDFVMSFPKGYDTDLGQGGVNVSGGQKQRLCIARALLKNPKIMILDDSTSAVDTATDAKIRESFKTEFASTTVFIIAQRITSVQNADKIIVMDNGKIAACGNHDELMASCETYREICEEQQKGASENE